MELAEALAIWRGSAYQKINHYLVKSKTGKTPRHYISALRKLNNDPEDIPAIIKTLKRGMKEIDTDRTYYRGDTKQKMKNCHVETFMSISKHEEDAEAFADEHEGNVVYEVRVKEGVKGVKVGSEGEILLEDGCFWEYSKKGGKHTATIHPPDAKKEYPFCTAAAVATRRSNSSNRRNTRRRSNSRSSNSNRSTRSRNSNRS